MPKPEITSPKQTTSVLPLSLSSDSSRGSFSVGGSSPDDANLPSAYELAFIAALSAGSEEALAKILAETPNLVAMPELTCRGRIQPTRFARQQDAVGGATKKDL